MKERWVGQGEYNRKRAAEIYLDFRVRKDRINELLGGLCKACGKTHKLALHHRIRHPVESNYPTHAKSMSVRIKRLAEAESHPERFILLCGSCHVALEWVIRMGLPAIVELL